MLTATELTSETKLALAKLFSEKKGKEIRKEVVAGEYAIDEIVHVKATLKVGEDYLATVPLKARPMTLAALFMSKVNAETRQAVCEEYARTVKEALACEDDDERDAFFAEREKEIKARAERAIKEIIKLTETLCKGKARCEVEILESLGE